MFSRLRSFAEDRPRRLRVLAATWLLTAWLAVGAASAWGAFPTPAWSTYHRLSSRTGYDPDSSHPANPRAAWQSPTLDGLIYAQPLVLGSRVFAATENNTLYALDAATGKVLWRRNAGLAVPDSAFQCVAIDPPAVGITGTPVLDPVTNTIYAVADVYSGGHAHHELVGYRITDGTPMITPRTLDVGAGANPLFVPEDELQRPGLALDGREVVATFGGTGGDCGQFHGWVVASRDDGTGPLLSYMVGSSSNNGGSIWGSGGGPVVDGAGSVYVTTGNGYSTTAYDYGNSIIKLSAGLQELDHYAPSTWANDNANDFDLASAGAVLLPGGLLFQSGKNGNGYLVRSATGTMGGTGVAGQPDPSAFHGPVCANGSWGGPAYFNDTIFVPCGWENIPGGMFALRYDDVAPNFSPLWTGPADAIGPPVVAGGLVWTVSYLTDTLYGLSLSTGQVKFKTSLPCSVQTCAMHFTSPSAGGGRLFVATGRQVSAFVISTLPKPILKITTPADGAVVTSSTVAVAGTVNDTVSISSVSVNGSPASRSQRNWSATVSGLTPGSNTLTATAVDGAGVSGQTSVTLTYQPAAAPVGRPGSKPSSAERGPRQLVRLDGRWMGRLGTSSPCCGARTR